MAEKKITYDDYLDIIINKAVEAAKARADYNKEIWGEQWSKNIDEDILKYANQYREALAKKKPYKDITEKELSDIAEFPADSMMQWVDGNFRGDSPWDVEKKVEASKIMPLLLGEAKEGKDWYSRTPLDLRGIGKKEFRYDTSTPEGFQGFLNKLGEYQQQYDRANMLKEFQDSGSNYWLSKLFYPSMTQEIENAIATGEGGDEATLKKLRALDIGANTAMALTPSIAIRGVNPLLMGSIDALGQGTVEAGRQAAKEQLSKTGQNADYSDAILAASLGATRPGMATMAAGATQTLPGKFAQDLARGFRSGSRTGGSVERARVANAVRDYNEVIANRINMTAPNIDKNELKFILTDHKGKLADAVKVPEMAKLFGVTPNANGKYSAEQILKYYDLNPEVPKVLGIKNGEISYGLRDNSRIPDASEFPTSKIDNWLGRHQPYMSLGKDKYGTYQNLFPEKAADLDANRAAYVLGQLGGKVIADVGGRAEPIAKANPLKIGESKAVQKSYTERYKDQPWFKKLDAESKKLLEEVLKAKSEE